MAYQSNGFSTIDQLFLLEETVQTRKQSLIKACMAILNFQIQMDASGDSFFFFYISQGTLWQDLSAAAPISYPHLLRSHLLRSLAPPAAFSLIIIKRLKLQQWQ